ncbi:MAG: hypothetical protein M1826_002507 [Phylliscum demangeonii]|nr:MAG: hypothetical protein M1826_002507 [Phylliscum demangeonii]
MVASQANHVWESTQLHNPHVVLSNLSAFEERHLHQTFKEKPTVHPTFKLREIRFYQKSVGLIFPKTRFRNLVRELCEEIGRDLRFQATGPDALQEQAEQYLTATFEVVNLAAMHAGRQTIMVRDFELIKKVTQQKQAFAVTDNTAPALGTVKIPWRIPFHAAALPRFNGHRKRSRKSFSQV